MSPHGPIEMKPKPITPEDVREWFRAAISRHPKLAHVNLDAAAEEFKAIALRANRVRQGGFLVGGRLRGSGVWKRFYPDDRRLQKHVEIQRDCRRAIAVLIAKLPYLAQTSAYDDDHMPDFDQAIESCKVIEKRLAPSKPIKVCISGLESYANRSPMRGRRPDIKLRLRRKTAQSPKSSAKRSR